MLQNSFLGLLNLISLAVALLIGEYEFAKMRTPDAIWLSTPVAFDLTLVSLITTLSLINISITIFVIIRHLDHHRYLLVWSTGVTLLFVVTLAIVLGPRFLPILWPTL